MELPELPSQENRPFRLSDYFPENVSWDKGIVYDPEAPFNLKLNHKGLKFRLDKDQKVKLMIDFLLNGDIKANTEIPMMGGTFNAQASRTNGENSYSGNLSIPAFGGRLEVGGGRQNDQTRANLLFKKDF